MIVQISCLGNYGRFGNSLFQYATAKTYAERHNCILETPPWYGDELFNLKDKPLSRKLPRYHHDQLPEGKVNVDLFGYFQDQNATKHLSRAKLKEWFKFQKRWTDTFPKKHKIVAHLRRGDYVKYSNVYCSVSRESYVKACEKYNINKDEIYWVSEENQKKTKYPWLDFLEDFFALMNADIILRANSSFSWWAATLSNAQVFAPVVGNLTGEHLVPFVEGNHPKMFSGFQDIHLKE